MPTIISIILFGLTLQSTPADPWINIRFIVGSWNGTVIGQPGSGTAARTYESVLGHKFALAS